MTSREQWSGDAAWQVHKVTKVDCKWLVSSGCHIIAIIVITVASLGLVFPGAVTSECHPSNKFVTFLRILEGRVSPLYKGVIR